MAGPRGHRRGAARRRRRGGLAPQQRKPRRAARHASPRRSTRQLRPRQANTSSCLHELRPTEANRVPSPSSLAGALANEAPKIQPRLHRRSFGLFARPSRPAGRAWPEKLASGLSPWQPRLNVWRIRHFASIPRWATQTYAFVGWQPQMHRDPLGLLGANTDINYDPACLEWKAKQSQRREAERAQREARRELVIAHLQARFKVQYGRAAGPHDVIHRDYKTGWLVYGNGAELPMSGIEADTGLETLIVTAGAGAFVTGASARAAGATTLQAARAAGASVVDDLAGGVLGVNPSLVRSGFRFLESRGAAIVENGTVVARARTPRSIPRTIVASNGEAGGLQGGPPTG